MLFPFLPIEHHDIRGLQPFLRVRHQGALGNKPGLFPRGAGIIRPFLLPSLKDQRKLIQRHAVKVITHRIIQTEQGLDSYLTVPLKHVRFHDQNELGVH